MKNLILGIIQWIIVILIIASCFIWMEYVKRVKSKKPPKSVRKIAFIKKYKINKRILYKIIPKKSPNNEFNILYFHGGAYSGGLTKIHWDFISRLVKDTHANIFVPDYPLIPHNTYKDVFNMADELYKNYLSKKDFIIMGDSAGGGISLAFSQKLGQENKKMPKKIILISPWLDITMKNKEIDNVQEKDNVLNKNALKLAGNLYCGKDTPNNYLVSPINGPTDKINHVLIFTGTYDILNPDINILKEKLVPKKLWVYEKKEAKHNWILETHKNEDDYQILLKSLLD